LAFGIDLTNIVAVRFDVGPSFGSSKGGSSSTI